MRPLFARAGSSAPTLNGEPFDRSTRGPAWPQVIVLCETSAEPDAGAPGPSSATLRIKVITTSSQDPNDTFADPLFDVDVMIGPSTAHVPADDDAARTTAAACDSSRGRREHEHESGSTNSTHHDEPPPSSSCIPRTSANFADLWIGSSGCGDQPLMRRTYLGSSLFVLFVVACGGPTSKGLPALEIEVERGIQGTTMAAAFDYSSVFVTAPLASSTDGPCEIIERPSVAGAPPHGRPVPDIGATVEACGATIPRKNGVYGSSSGSASDCIEGQLVEVVAGGGATFDLQLVMPSKPVVVSPPYVKRFDEEGFCDGHLAVPSSEELVVRRTPGDADDVLVVDLWATPMLRARCTSPGDEVRVPPTVLAWLAAQDGPRSIRIGALREADEYVGGDRVAITLLSTTDLGCLDFLP